MEIKRPRGTNDLLPSDTYKWQKVELLLRQICREFNFKEIRTPIFEATELFQRGVGDSTDIVQKEMYTFLDKGGRSITLRPENTASVARAYIENKLEAQVQPLKLYYIGPMFRYERPQSGRFRQFHQFGIEIFGTESPYADAEAISLAWEIYRRLGIKGLELHLNSLGCPECRKAYREALRNYLKPRYADLCETCRGRYETNPLRIMDCKSPVCQEIINDCPTLDQYLCESCRADFQKVQEALNAAGIPYILDARLVRGLDYYTKTAFEIIAGNIGAQSAVCGGGRYDGLLEEIGGKPTPGVGFALGMERIFTVLDAQGLDIFKEEGIDVFVAILTQEKEALNQAFAISSQLRLNGLKVEQDLLCRSLKSQFKQADRLNATYTVIVGGDELKDGNAVVRQMSESEQHNLPIIDIANYLKQKKVGD